MIISEQNEAVMRDWNDLKTKLDPASSYCDEIRSGGGDTLTGLLQYAIDNTEFYSEICAPELKDFPVVDKNILRENHDRIFVDSFRDKRIHTMHTSGSTGIPFTIEQDMDKRNRHIADLKFFGELAGYEDGTSMGEFRSKVSATVEEQKSRNIWQMNICSMSEEVLERYYHLIVEKKCVALLGFASTLDTAAKSWKSMFPKNQTIVKSIISTSETLTDETRSRLENYFGSECSVRSRYSNEEAGILGQENGVPGQFFLNWGSYYFEVLKMDADKPAENGELGRVVITDLYNKAFPMIRYDTGDVARMIYPDHGFPYFKELYGRRMDLIYDTNGNVVSPFLFTRVMKYSNGVQQWQFIQETECDYRLKVCPILLDDCPSCEKELHEFSHALGNNANIVLEYVDKIPVLNSLKRKLIISKLKH